MFGLNPVTLYLIVGLVVTNLLTAFAWQMEKHAVQAQKERVAVCEARFGSFKKQVEILGKQQETKTAEVIAASNLAVEETRKKYEANLDRLRADYQRMRKQYANSGSGSVSVFPVSASAVDEIPADALPLAEQCAETTLTLESLQGWVTQQAENVTELHNRNDTAGEHLGP